MTKGQANVTGWQQPIEGRCFPASIGDVIKEVKQALNTHIAVYPVSKGLNWGYGSESPAQPNCRIIDLSRMNRILNADEISEDNPVALIEPGVTQGQLYDFVQAHCPGLTFNVTGSARDTSIIGNALDRGVGYFGPRKDDLFGLEIVTGTGEVLRTGFRRLGDESPLAHSHPFGLGPILDGLFFQGNFGIVTSACFRLRTRRPKEVALSLALREAEDLPEFIDVLARLKREGLLISVTHIGNLARTHATLSFGIARYLQQECGLNREDAVAEMQRAMDKLAPHEWTSLASVSGNAGQVRASIREIRKRMRSLARLMVITERRLNVAYAVTHRLRFWPFARANAAAIAATRPLHGLALGIPTDVPVQNLLWKFAHPTGKAVDLDESRCGLLYVCPALPLDGQLATEVIREMKKIATRYGHLLYITLNIETETSLVAVINLLFDRAIPAEGERAHACANALLEYIRSQGLEPYRARADMMPRILETTPEYWNIIRKLKSAFDPANIIAPGRYNIPV